VGAVGRAGHDDGGAGPGQRAGAEAADHQALPHHLAGRALVAEGREHEGGRPAVGPGAGARADAGVQGREHRPVEGG
jgi:hypothetical protein